MKKATKIILALMVAMMFQTGTVFCYELEGLRAFGADTVAGYSAALTTSKTMPDKDVFFSVVKPGGSILTIPAKTSSDGVARIDLYDYHTRVAGTYSVSAYIGGNSAEAVKSFFTVHPDKVSVSESMLISERTVVKADAKDKGYIKVVLADKYGNNLSGHIVRLISSRSEDVVMVSSPSSVTDNKGEIVFAVSSGKPGVSIYSVVDTTTGVVLNDRMEIAFLNDVSYLNDAGGHIEYFIPVASAQDAGPLNKFEISGLADSVQANTNLSFTVTAQDQNGLTVQNYTGTVHFSVEGPNGLNVTLPEDYTFKAEDLGRHEFSLGLKFIENGSYTLAVTDISNTSIKGELDVEVGTSGQTVSGGGEKPAISSPVEGTYSQNVQTVAGTSKALSTIKIFDGTEEIGMVQTDSTGRFSFQTNPLEDGDHEIYAVLLDESNAVAGTSDTVEFTVDTTAPSVGDIQISPEDGIKAGDVIDLTVISEANLSDSAVIFNLDIYPLARGEGQEGTYVTSFQAPLEAGDYPVDVLLIDELGNEATYQGVATVTITENGDADVVEEEQTGDEELVEDDDASLEPPSQVYGVIAYGSDERVTLVWEAATDDGIINNYKIYYGEDALNLNNVVETKDAATTWYIPGLENGKEYFFAVSAVDDTMTESLFTSELVSAIPFTLEVQTAVTERPDMALGSEREDAYLRGAAIEERAPDEMAKNGPELIWLLAGTGVFSAAARKLTLRKKKR